jgi:RNA ligase partner protein
VYTGLPLIYVLDTSAITDPRLRKIFNVSTLDGVVREYARLLIRAHIVLGAEFYTTPSTAMELESFLERNGVDRDAIEMLMGIITIRSPDLYTTRIPAIVMSDWIHDMLIRITKGLRVAEESVRRAARRGYDHGLSRDKGGLEETIAEEIHDLREKYREATRKGVIDTRVDFDLVILTHELKGELVTNDTGIMKLCEQIGVRYIEPPRFINKLTILLRERTGRA